MGAKVSGVIHGRRIDLERAVGLPDGAPVLVEIEPGEVSAAERHALVTATAGAWAGDASLAPLFAEVLQRREENSERSLNFDDSA